MFWKGSVVEISHPHEIPEENELKFNNQTTRWG